MIETPTTVREARTFVNLLRRKMIHTQSFEEIVDHFEFVTGPLRAMMEDDEMNKGFDVYMRAIELFNEAAVELVESASMSKAWDAAYEILGHSEAFAILLNMDVKDVKAKREEHKALVERN